jgi:hypothetical protein
VDAGDSRLLNDYGWGEPVNLDIFEKMEPSALRKYIEFLLWHYRVIDAFWFIYVVLLGWPLRT